MQLTKPRPLVLLAALLALLLIAGCGGGSDDPASNQAKSSTADGSAKTETVPAEKKEKPSSHSQGQKAKGKSGKAEKKSARAEAEDLIRKAGKNGVEVDADSPMAKKLIESLGEGKGGKRGKNAPNSVVKAVEKILAPPQGGNDDRSSGAPGEGVEKILEQIGK